MPSRMGKEAEMSVVATCPEPCNQKNRLKPGTRQACGKCGRIFNDREVMVATLGERVGIPDHDLPEPDYEMLSENID